MVFIRLERDTGNLWRIKIEVMERVERRGGEVFGRFMLLRKLNIYYGVFVGSVYQLDRD
jgi:hypothetical protein